MVLVIFIGGEIFYVVLHRLFTTVRDSLGLTYDVSFELNLFDRLNLGWYVVSVTSTPAKVCMLYLYIFEQNKFRHFSLSSHV